MEKQKDTKKIALIAGAVVVVVAAAVLVGRSDLFQGKFLGFVPTKQASSIGQMYQYGKTPGKVVTPVTSPVPSVVPSAVPSQVGPSIVVSKVPSIVVSPVASAVMVPKDVASKVNLSTLPLLTKDVLEKTAKDYYRKYPAKFKLSKDAEKRIIDLYNSKMVKPRR